MAGRTSGRKCGENHNLLPLKIGMAAMGLAEKLRCRYKAMRRAVDHRNTRKLGAPAVEGGVIKPKKQCPQASLQSCFGSCPCGGGWGLTKAQAAIDTKPWSNYWNDLKTDESFRSGRVLLASLSINNHETHA